MIALLQRVSRADVVVDGKTVGAVGRGFMVLVCAEKGDTDEKAVKLAAKLLKFRVFPDEAGKMNRSVKDVALVSQFTLAADTASGNRPSFSSAADPETGRRLYELFVAEVRKSGLKTETGVFGAHMQVSLTNDGPVTFTLRL